MHLHSTNRTKPECLLPADTARIGESVGHIENSDQPTAEAGTDQTPRHVGQDWRLTSQVLTEDCMADKKVSVEDDPHGEKSVPGDQALHNETEDTLAKGNCF